MNRRVVSRYEMFNRAITFGKTNEADFTPKSTAITEFAELERVAEELSAAQGAQKDSDTVTKSVLMDALRMDAKNVWRTAYAIGQKEVGFAGRFKQPDAAGEGPLLVAVDATIAELEKPGVAAKFIAHDLPKSFVAELKQARSAAMNARHEAESNRQTKVTSTTSIDRLIAEGLQHVTTLNAIMHNKYSRVPEKLRAWKSAIHVDRSAPRQKTTTGTAAASAASATSTASA